VQVDVLVVDDDEAIREALVQILEREGLTVGTAAQGGEALSSLENGLRPRVILLDLMMPVMDGSELLALLQQDARLRGIPVLVMTAADVVPRLAVAVEVLAKPLSLRPLFAALSRYCPLLAD
jgi:CheY-like chemotaxis protein